MNAATMLQGGLLRELVDLAAEYAAATRADCLTVTPGHESMCQCEPHLHVRRVGDRLDALIDEIRNA